MASKRFSPEDSDKCDRPAPALFTSAMIEPSHLQSRGDDSLLEELLLWFTLAFLLFFARDMVIANAAAGAESDTPASR